MPLGFILQPTYRLEGGRPVVHLYGTLEGGQSFLVRDDRIRPRFWIPLDDMASARGLGAAVGEEPGWTSLEGQGGGHVLEPRQGLHRNVLVFDFQSLYPSVMRTFNIDPLGHIAAGDDTDPIVAPNGAPFSRTPAILPALLDELIPRRERAKQAGDAIESQAIKILMNSFYGVLGTSACRFADPALANAITAFGREILLWTKRRFEELGYDVLYGDTDSLFVASGQQSPDAATALRWPRMSRIAGRCGASCVSSSSACTCGCSSPRANTPPGQPKNATADWCRRPAGRRSCSPVWKRCDATGRPSRDASSAISTNGSSTIAT